MVPNDATCFEVPVQSILKVRIVENKRGSVLSISASDFLKPLGSFGCISCSESVCPASWRSACWIHVTVHCFVLGFDCLFAVVRGHLCRTSAILLYFRCGFSYMTSDHRKLCLLHTELFLVADQMVADQINGYKSVRNLSCGIGC